MNKQGWLTRTADSIGGEGQSSATLTARKAADPTNAAEPVLVGEGV
jgi:hyaluronan synthase